MGLNKIVVKGLENKISQIKNLIEKLKQDNTFYHHEIDVNPNTTFYDGILLATYKGISAELECIIKKLSDILDEKE